MSKNVSYAYYECSQCEHIFKKKEIIQYKDHYGDEEVLCWDCLEKINSETKGGTEVYTWDDLISSFGKGYMLGTGLLIFAWLVFKLLS